MNTGLGLELPLQTRALIATSAVVSTWWPVLVAAPVVGFVVLRFAMARSERLRLARDGWVLRLPWVGDVARKIVLARFANTFALMFGSGIAVLHALAHCERAAGNLAIGHALGRARALVGQGTPVSEAVLSQVAEVPLAWSTALFLLLSAFFHFLIASPIGFGAYGSELRRGRNRFRWVEYSLSSTLMIVLIAMVTGILDLADQCVEHSPRRCIDRTVVVVEPGGDPQLVE